MRISDLSSDVCSSDLHAAGACNRNRRTTTDVRSANRGPSPIGRPHVSGRTRARVDPATEHYANGEPGYSSNGPLSRGTSCAGDRTSVVEGKSVSVRVDLGGRRIIKNKMTKRTK